MHLRETLFVLCLLAVRFVTGDVVAVKCCAVGEQLHRKSNTCITVESKKIVNLAQEPDSFSGLDSRNGTESGKDKFISFNIDIVDGVAVGDNSSTDPIWLPEVLRERVTNYDEVLFGRQQNCSASFTIRLESSRDGHRMRWLQNGSLILRSYNVKGGYDERRFDAQEFCMDTFTEEDNITTQHVVLMCSCDQVKCIKKCCPFGQSYVRQFNVPKGQVRFMCRPYNGTWTPFDLNVHEQNLSFETIAGYAKCPKDYASSIQLMYPGIPAHIVQRTWIDTAEDGAACEDSVVVQEQHGDVIVPITEIKGVVRCFPRDPIQPYVYYINWLHVPQIICWALVIITTELVPRKPATPNSQVHEHALVWHAVSLMLRSLLYLTKNLWDRYCIYTSIIIYFCGLSASLWLSVLSINMAAGFWRPLGARQRQKKGFNKLLVWYSLYAWGVTGAMTVFTGVMWYCDDVPRWMLRPTMHETGTCFIETDRSQKLATFAYFYGPVGALLMINVALFLSITVRVRHMQRHTSILRRQREEQAKQAKQGATGQATSGADRSAMVYVKLLLFIGVIEMAFEFMTWFLNSIHGYFWFIVLWVDIIRAVSMFVATCCNKRALHGVRDRFCAGAAINGWRRWRAQRKTREPNAQGVTGQYSNGGEDT